jgi:hypothetical protein
MNRLTGAITLLALISLAVCESEALPMPVLSQPSEDPPPQTSTGKPFFTETGLASFYGPAQNGNTPTATNSVSPDYRRLIARWPSARLCASPTPRMDVL